MALVEALERLGDVGELTDLLRAPTAA
jgi:hypothetical protein